MAIRKWSLKRALLMRGNASFCVRWVVFRSCDEAVKRDEGHFAGDLHSVHLVQVSSSDARVGHDVVEQTASSDFHRGEERLSTVREDCTKLNLPDRFQSSR